MEEQERDLTKAYDLQQPDFRAAENSSLDKGTKPSESGTELELATNIDTHLTEENPASVQNSSTGSLRTQSVVIFDPNGQPLRCEGMVIGQCENGELYVIRSNPLGGTQVLLHNDQLLDAADPTATCIGKPNQEDPLTPAETALDSGTNALCTEAAPGFTDAKVHAKSSPEEYVPSPKPLTAAAPNWANRLRSCEKLGDSYRGYCNTETELEAVLLLHKQQTHSVFGTRQSPSPAKPATRLMWKSQYVPYDGIPFVNAGSRAIVMECQFGPRRKGLQPKKGNLQETCTNIDYKATCPARIYIKKVRKFPEYKVPVDPKVDKKVVRQEQEKAFFNLKKKLWNTGGVIRYYIQLPTQKAHLYHDVDTIILPPLPEQPDLMKEETEEEEQEMIGSEGAEEEEDGEAQGGGPVPSRLHPLVAEKIRVLVAQGCSQVYTVRKQLRRFVEREMFKSNVVPERHNLCYFPTVNDIKNHIHEAQRSLQLTDGVPASPDAEWKTESEHLLTETVTLTLTPASINVSSQKEGLLEGSHTLSPEAVHFFSSLTSLQPKIFAHLQGIQLQCATCPAEGSLAPQPISATEPLDPSNPLYSQAVFLSPASFLQSTPTVGEAVSLPEPPALVGIGQLVSISTMEPGTTEAGVTQILLEDGQAIPVQIVDPSGIALRASAEEVLMRESSETKPMDISPEPPRDQG